MKKEQIREVKSDANHAKESLMSLEYRLMDIGAIKEAEQLNKIIMKLEVWQNR